MFSNSPIIFCCRYVLHNQLHSAVVSGHIKVSSRLPLHVFNSLRLFVLMTLEDSQAVRFSNIRLYLQKPDTCTHVGLRLNERIRQDTLLCVHGAVGGSLGRHVTRLYEALSAQFHDVTSTSLPSIHTCGIWLVLLLLLLLLWCPCVFKVRMWV